MTKPKPKKERIVALRARGHSYWDIAEKVEVSESYVYRVLRQAGVVERRKKGGAR